MKFWRISCTLPLAVMTHGSWCRVCMQRISWSLRLLSLHPLQSVELFKSLQLIRGKTSFPLVRREVTAGERQIIPGWMDEAFLNHGIHKSLVHNQALNLPITDWCMMYRSKGKDPSQSLRLRTGDRTWSPLSSLHHFSSPKISRRIVYSSFFEPLLISSFCSLSFYGRSVSWQLSWWEESVLWLTHQSEASEWRQTKTACVTNHQKEGLAYTVSARNCLTPSPFSCSWNSSQAIACRLRKCRLLLQKCYCLFFPA